MHRVLRMRNLLAAVMLLVGVFGLVCSVLAGPNDWNNNTADLSGSGSIQATLDDWYAVEPGYLVVGDATSNRAEVAVSGDVTMTSAGVFTYTADSTILPGYLIVGDATSNRAEVAVSGDATLAADGTLSLSAVRIDTNATTTIADYTPARVGEIIAGKIGGTNVAWLAVGATTNDWLGITIHVQ